MFKDTASYHKAIKRIDFLKGFEHNDRLSADDAYELAQLEVAVQMFEDVLEAEARAEQDFMQRFEDAFLASMER